MPQKSSKSSELNVIPKLSWGEHPLWPKHFLPEIQIPILYRGAGRPPRPSADEDWRGIAAPLHAISPPSRPNRHPEGSGGGAPSASVREGDGCIVALQRRRISQPLSVAIFSERKPGEFWDDLEIRPLPSRSNRHPGRHKDNVKRGVPPSVPSSLRRPKRGADLTAKPSIQRA